MIVACEVNGQETSELHVKCRECNGIRVQSANWHLTTKCCYKCKFCFIQRLDAEIRNLTRAERVLEKLKDLGVEKINFAGGEPLLHPLFFDIIKMAKNMEFTVSMISNGYYLDREVVFKLSSFVDWIGLSIDSAHEEIEVALGRGNGNHVEHVMEVADFVRVAGVKLKINTTVTRLNWAEDMRSLLKSLNPERWKAFQVLHIEGQNDRFFDELSITDEQFSHFKSINQMSIRGTSPVFEGNREMIDSYFMISPGGMAMSNRQGTKRVFTPLDNISCQNIEQLLDVQRYVERGGTYSW